MVREYTKPTAGGQRDNKDVSAAHCWTSSENMSAWVPSCVTATDKNSRCDLGIPCRKWP